MVTSRHWARKFAVTSNDIDYLINLLVEKETPLSTDALARMLVEHKLEMEASELQERFKDATIFDPAKTYKVGQRVVFPALEFATGVVQNVRQGDNPAYGEFDVIETVLENDEDAQPREFAANFPQEHALNISDDDAFALLPGANDFDAGDVIAENYEMIIGQIEEQLVKSKSLVYVARTWFPSELVMEVNEGHLNLAEAVLDMYAGGPLTTEQIIKEIGGLGKAPMELQVFSLNYGMKDDDRFDEVGPTGEVLWFLTRLEPQEVRKTPTFLQYNPIPFDDTLISDSMRSISLEIDDELSGLETIEGLDMATVTLIYPHRRVGTLPLNSRTRALFPTARRAPRIWVTLIDGQDGEEFNGWVVHKENYVFGLGRFYAKHKVPIGAQVTVKRSDREGMVIIDIDAYKPRTEYIPLLSAKGDVPQFENDKRAIGADYDDLMIIGVDDLDEIDHLTKVVNDRYRPLISLMKLLIPPLGRLTPQGTVHFKSLYTAVNVIRRCPPEPMMVALNTSPDFENVGGDYWKLSE